MIDNAPLSEGALLVLLAVNKGGGRANATPEDPCFADCEDLVSRGFLDRIGPMRDDTRSYSLTTSGEAMVEVIEAIAAQ